MSIRRFFVLALVLTAGATPVPAAEPALSQQFLPGYSLAVDPTTSLFYRIELRYRDSREAIVRDRIAPGWELFAVGGSNVDEVPADLPDDDGRGRVRLRDTGAGRFAVELLWRPGSGDSSLTLFLRRRPQFLGDEECGALMLTRGPAAAFERRSDGRESFQTEAASSSFTTVRRTDDASDWEFEEEPFAVAAPMCVASLRYAYLDPTGGGDLDNDGLTDYLEACVYGTPPCVSDDDADGVHDGSDNCPLSANPDQADENADGFGDACASCVPSVWAGFYDPDHDELGVDCDNCPLAFNPFQEDSDADGIGDACVPCSGAEPRNQIVVPVQWDGFPVDPPQRTPDGRSLVFVRSLASNYPYDQLYQVAVSGGPSIELSDVSVNGKVEKKFHVMAAGRFAVFSGGMTTDRRALFRVPLGGGPVEQMTAPFSDGVGKFYDGPKGDWVLFHTVDAGRRSHLFSLSMAGFDLHPLLDAADIYSVALTPDESTVLVNFRETISAESRLFSIPVAGGAPTELGRPQGRGRVSGVRLTPDSTRVVYISDERTPGTSEVFSVPPGGGVPTLVAPYTEIGLPTNFFDFSSSGDVVYRYFRRINGSVWSGLARVSVGGGAPEILFDPKPEIGSLAWPYLAVDLSPRTERVAFVVEDGPGAGLYITNDDGKAPRRVVSGVVQDFGFNAQDTRMFVNDGDFLRTMDLNGANRVVAWEHLPLEENAAGTTFTEDGLRLVFKPTTFVPPGGVGTKVVVASAVREYSKTMVVSSDVCGWFLVDDPLGVIVCSKSPYSHYQSHKLFVYPFDSDGDGVDDACEESEDAAVGDPGGGTRRSAQRARSGANRIPALELERRD